MKQIYKKADKAGKRKDGKVTFDDALKVFTEALEVESEAESEEVEVPDEEESQEVDDGSEEEAGSNLRCYVDPIFADD